MLAANEQIDWHPEHIKHGRFGKWLEGNVDWALSRERYWGTPLPIWECTGADCDERFCAGSIAELRERGGEVPDDLHRPYIDEVVLRCESCGGEMRRVEEVIDAWYDSGSMPFAQFHYPFEGQESFEERFPAEFICEAIDQTRGWFYSLLAVSTLLFDESSYRHCVCLGPDPRPRGPEDVEEPRQRGRARRGDRRATAPTRFRWYYLTSQQPWAGYRFSVETVGESVRQFMLTLWNTYSFWVLYANAEGSSGDDFAGERPRRAGGRRSTGGRFRGCRRRSSEVDRAARGIRLDRGRPGDRRLRRRALELVRAAVAAALLGGRPRRRSRPCATACSSVAALLAPFVPFLADEIYANLAGGETASSAPTGLRPPAATTPSPTTRCSTTALELGMEAVRRAVELGRAARAQAGVKVRQPLRKAVIVATDAEREHDRAPRRPRRARAERQAARVRGRGGRARQLRGEAELPLARPAVREADAPGRGAIEALDPGTVAEAVAGRAQGRDQRQRRRSRAGARRRHAS